MPEVALVTTVLQVITILGSVLTLLKLRSSGLYRRYRIFFVYFAFRIPYMAGFMILSRMKGLHGGEGNKSDAYFRLFFWSEPLLILLYILVVVELYSLVLERYKGLYTLGRWAMYASVVIAATISIVSLLPKLGSSIPEPSKRLMYELAAERGVDLALVIFILLIVLFLSRYPVPLSRNVVVHTGIYSVFFLSGTLVLVIRTVFGYNVNDTTNMCLSALSAACTIAWWLLLSAKGEEVQFNVPQLRPGSEERILQQLDTLNATLLKVSKKSKDNILR